MVGKGGEKMSYKMLINKQKFMKTEFGQGMEGVIRAWDMALQQSREDSTTLRDLAWCQAQWEVYRLAIKQFYGVEYHFTRTDEYFGVCTEDESDYLMKIYRIPVKHGKPYQGAWSEKINKQTDTYPFKKKLIEAGLNRTQAASITQAFWYYYVSPGIPDMETCSECMKTWIWKTCPELMEAYITAEPELRKLF